MPTFKTIALACAGACVAAPAFAASLSTGFTSNIFHPGNMFDIEVGATHITITALDINLPDGNTNVTLYYRLGSYAGNTGSLAGWKLRDSATPLTGDHADTPSPWDVVDQSFAAGQLYGIHIVTTDGKNLAYSGGTSEGAVLATDGDLTIYEGADVVVGVGSIFSPRSWNGTIT